MLKIQQKHTYKKSLDLRKIFLIQEDLDAKDCFFHLIWRPYWSRTGKWLYWITYWETFRVLLCFNNYSFMCTGKRLYWKDCTGLNVLAFVLGVCPGRAVIWRLFFLLEKYAYFSKRKFARNTFFAVFHDRLVLVGSHCVSLAPFCFS